MFSYLAVHPTKLYFVHAPELMDVLSQLVPHIFKMWRQDNLDQKTTPTTKKYKCKIVCLCLHLIITLNHFSL